MEKKCNCDWSDQWICYYCDGCAICCKCEHECDEYFNDDDDVDWDCSDEDDGGDSNIGG